jgi:hypothetical protein
MSSLLARSVQIILAWQGFRYDIEGMSLLWKVVYFLLIAGLAVAGVLLGMFATLPVLVTLTVAGWTIYYVGNSLMLTCGNRFLVAKFGESAAWQLYCVLVGCMFSCQGKVCILILHT